MYEHDDTAAPLHSCALQGSVSPGESPVPQRWNIYKTSDHRRTTLRHTAAHPYVIVEGWCQLRAVTKVQSRQYGMSFFSLLLRFELGRQRFDRMATASEWPPLPAQRGSGRPQPPTLGRASSSGTLPQDAFGAADVDMVSASLSGLSTDDQNRAQREDSCSDPSTSASGTERHLQEHPEHCDIAPLTFPHPILPSA